MNLKDLPPTLSVPEAARIYGISRNTAYEAIKRGEIPSISVGRRVLVPTAKALAQLGVEVNDTAEITKEIKVD